MRLRNAVFGGGARKEGIGRQDGRKEGSREKRQSDSQHVKKEERTAQRNREKGQERESSVVCMALAFRLLWVVARTHK